MASVRPLTFADLLRRYRRSAGLSQEELAGRAGLSRRAVSDLERASSRIPRKDTVELLAEALDLAPQERTRFVLAASRQHPVQPTVTGATPGPSTLLHPVALPPLVGRREELALLDHQLQGMGPPLLLLAGEPGIGKTRLLREAAERARAAGWCVLEGGCYRRDAQGPYAPLLGALSHYLTQRTPSQLRTELAGCAWLVRLLPELAETAVVPLPEWALPPEQERRLMFAAVGRFLSNIAGPSGTLLVLDDLQWAGDDGLDLLSSLVREQSSRPVCVLGACRSTEVHQGDVLSALLVDLARDGMLSHVGIEVLARREAAELLRTLLEGGEDPSVVERVLQRSGGVPFFLVSCARALHVGALGEVPANVPWDAAESIRQRVAALPTVSRQLLGVAAVVGRTATRALIATVLERAEDEVLTLAEESCEARLLLESGAEAYEFAHDLIREVVESDLSAGRRRLLHRRIAGALEQSATAAAPEVVAYHYEQGGVVGKAVGYLEQAAIVAQHTGAFVEARRHMEHALALAPQEDHLRLQEQLGDCAAMGEVALAGYQRALRLWRHLPLAAAGHLHDELTGARLLRKLLTCYQRTTFAVSVQWSHEELEALAAEMIQLAEATGDEDELWRARLVNLALLQDSGPITAEVSESWQAVSLAAANYFEAQGNWVAFSQAMEVHIGTIWDAGAGDEAIAAAKHWFAIAQLPPLERGQAFARVITMCELLGRYDDALALAGQMVEQIQPGEPMVHLNDGFQHATLAAWLSGHWSEHEEIMAMISQVWEQVQYSPRVVNMLGGYETALIIARAREDQNAVEFLIPVLEHILSAEWRAKNLALIAAHVHDDPRRLDLTVPLTSLPMLTIHTLMFLSERNLTAPSAFLEAARAQSEATTWDALNWCVVVGEALAAGDHAELASAIDEAEIHGLAPHAARMRIVLAERSGDLSYLEHARPVLERLGDRLFLRRLEAVATKLP